MFNFSEPHCVALYDYVPQCAGDLAFKEGDVIKILRKVDSNWIEGEFFGSKGIFPSNFVRIEQDLPNANSGMSTTGFQPKPTKDMRKVLYTYQASSYDEISVNVSFSWNCFYVMKFVSIVLVWNLKSSFDTANQRFSELAAARLIFFSAIQIGGN